MRWPPLLHMIPDMGYTLVLDENKPFWPQLSQSHSHSLRVWTHALARVQGRPEAYQAKFHRGAENHRKTSLPSEYPSIGGSIPEYHGAMRSCRQHASSPGSAESCRQMPVIKGKKTLQTCKDQQCVRSWSDGFAHRQQVAAMRCASTK